LVALIIFSAGMVKFSNKKWKFKGQFKNLLKCFIFDMEYFLLTCVEAAFVFQYFKVPSPENLKKRDCPISS